MGWLNLLVSLLGLVVAVVLLVAVLRLRKVALGGAIADNLPYVVLAIVSFAGSALTGWVANFLGDEAAIAQANLASKVLVVLGMGFLAAYFFRVQGALNKYLGHARRRLARSRPSSSGSDVPESEQSDRG